MTNSACGAHLSVSLGVFLTVNWAEALHDMGVKTSDVYGYSDTELLHKSSKVGWEK